MRLFLRIILVSFFAVFLAGNAMAVPFDFGDGGAALQKVLDDITKAPVNGDSSIDVTQDAIADSYDSYWKTTATGGSFSTIVIELAGFANQNEFGVYGNTTNGIEYLRLFEGDDVAGDQATLSFLDDGSVFVNLDDTGINFIGSTFGYYLDSTANTANGGGLFHSDTSLNIDSLDHMAAYQGLGIDQVKLPNRPQGEWTVNEYVLAFEDLVGPVTGVSDRDFTDFVVMVESVKPTPEPATMFLLGLGLVGLAGITRKKAA